MDRSNPALTDCMDLCEKKETQGRVSWCVSCCFYFFSLAFLPFFCLFFVGALCESVLVNGASSRCVGGGDGGSGKRRGAYRLVLVGTYLFLHCCSNGIYHVTSVNGLSIPSIFIARHETKDE